LNDRGKKERTLDTRKTEKKTGDHLKQQKGDHKKGKKGQKPENT